MAIVLCPMCLGNRGLSFIFYWLSKLNVRVCLCRCFLELLHGQSFTHRIMGARGH